MPSASVEQRLLSNFSNHDYAVDANVLQRGIYTIPKGADILHFKLACDIQVEGGSLVKAWLYVGQPDTPGVSLYNAQAQPLFGSKIYALGSLVPDFHSTLETQVDIEDFVDTKPLTWQLLFVILGGKQTLTAPVGALRVAITPDNLNAYVTSAIIGGTTLATYTLGRPTDAQGENYTGIILNDARGADITIDSGPFDVDCTDTRVIVPCFGADSVQIIDRATNTVINTTAVTDPVCVTISPDGTYALIGTVGGNTYKILLNSPFTLTGPVDLGTGDPLAGCFNLAGTKAYFAFNGESGAVKVIDPVTLTNSATISVGGIPVDVKTASDGNVWAVMDSTNRLKGINTTSDTVIADYPLGFTIPNALALVPTGGQTSPTVRTAWVVYDNKSAEQIQIGGEFPGQRGSNFSSSVVTSGNVSDVAFTKHGEPYIVGTNVAQLIKFPNARYVYSTVVGASPSRFRTYWSASRRLHPSSSV